MYRTNQRYEAERAKAEQNAKEGFEELRKLEAAELESTFRPFPLYKTDQTIDLIDRRLTVHPVEYFADPSLKENGHTSDNGLALRVSIHNVGNSPIRVDFFDFAIEDEKRRLLINTGKGKEPGLPVDGTLAPGDWIEGYINFFSDGTHPMFLYYRELIGKRPFAVIDIE